MDAPSEPSPAGNCRGGGCFNFFRRAFSTDQSSIPSVKSVINVTDDYVIMKQQLITKPLLRAELTEPHHHFTERDVRADFASGMCPKRDQFLQFILGHNSPFNNH